jgi:hypothetical protein
MQAFQESEILNGYLENSYSIDSEVRMVRKMYITHVMSAPWDPEYIADP